MDTFTSYLMDHFLEDNDVSTFIEDNAPLGHNLCTFDENNQFDNWSDWNSINLPETSDSELEKCVDPTIALPELTSLCTTSCKTYVQETNRALQYPTDDNDPFVVLGVNLENLTNNDNPNPHLSGQDIDKQINSSSKNLSGSRFTKIAKGTDEKTFQCGYIGCGKIYSKSSHLKAHIRRHTGEKPFKCNWPQCTWKFSRSDELGRHKRSHSGDKPYGCTVCEKKFARSDHLNKHLKVHIRSGAWCGGNALEFKKVGRRGRPPRKISNNNTNNNSCEDTIVIGNSIYTSKLNDNASPIPEVENILNTCD